MSTPIHPAIANLSPKRLAAGIYWERSWNVVRGCSKVSPGCDHCWLERETMRFAGHPNPKISLPAQHVVTGQGWTGNVVLDEAALLKPASVKKPTVWAVWSDLFHPALPVAAIGRVFAMMAMCPHHLFVVLTKRPAKMATFCSMNQYGLLRQTLHEMGAPDINPGWPLPNVWLGVTAENQMQADERIPILLDTPAALRFVSVEPMLGWVNLSLIDYPDAVDSEVGLLDALRGTTCDDSPTHHALDWVIAGGESGPGARPMHPNWVRSLRDECVDASVPFLLKQWGEFAPCRLQKIHGAYNRTNGRDHWELDPECNGTIHRIGKHHAGRLLDGVKYDQFPAGEKGTVAA